MNRALRWKSILIAAVVLMFLYGIFGIPRSLTEQGLAHSLLRRIHLGLDLKGGTHLILQVQVNDAINAEARQAMVDLQRSLQDRNIPFASTAQPHPIHSPDHILIQGVPPRYSPDLREIVQRQLPDYQMAPGAHNSWMLSMKPASLADLKDRTVTQESETIRNRIDQLGVTEPIIERYGMGQYQILVELPGVTDPGRVEKIMQTTAMLEIRQVLSGPYLNERQTLVATNGVLPPNTVLLQGGGTLQTGDASGPPLYLVSAIPAVTGRDLRAGVGSTELGRPDVDFHADHTRRPQVRRFHRFPHRRSTGGGAGQ